MFTFCHGSHETKQKTQQTLKSVQYGLESSLSIPKRLH